MKKILLLAAALCCGAVSRCTASDDSVRTKSNNKKENLLQLFDTLCRELRDFLPKEEMLNGMIRGVQEGYVKFTDCNG